MEIIITSGGLIENIDSVRKITNTARGRLGKVIAKNAIKREEINRVYYLGPSNSHPSIKSKKLILIGCDNYISLQNHLKELLLNEKIDAVIHSCAVSDYSVDSVVSVNQFLQQSFEKVGQNQLSEDQFKTLLSSLSLLRVEDKVSSKNGDLLVYLKKNEKIISKIKKWSPSTTLIGFKLLNNSNEKELIRVGLNLKKENNCHMVLANDMTQINDHKHIGYLIKNENCIVKLENREEISEQILNELAKLRGEKNES